MLSVLLQCIIYTICFFNENMVHTIIKLFTCTLIIQINHMQFSCRNRLWNSFSKMRSNGTENESMLDILTHAWIYWLWRLNSSLVSKLRNFLYQKIIIRLWTFVLELHPKSICTTAAWLVLPWQILHHGIAKQPTIPLVTFIGI